MALLALLSSLAQLTSAASVPVHAESTGFVTVQGKDFLVDNKKVFWKCANYWQAMFLGVTDPAQLKKDVADMKEKGINCVRIMATSEGNGPFRTSPSTISAPGQYNEETFKGLDLTMSVLHDADIKAIVCMNNFWHWSGGFAQYVSWVSGQPIPYPPSWDAEKGTYTPGNWDDFTNFSRRFYWDQRIQDIYRDHIKKIVSRTNTVSGLKYAEDSVVLAWELANEPSYPPFEWVDGTSAFIKSLAPKHLVTVGHEAKTDEEDFATSHKSSHVDFTTVHIWAQNRDVYDMNNSTDAHLQNAISWAKDRLALAKGWSDKLNKPLLLEEFGLARDNWLSPPKNPYSAASPISHRDKYFDALIGSAAETGCAGFGFWVYSGTMKGADPPHEPSGWYSVYANDTSTFDIMKKWNPTA